MKKIFLRAGHGGKDTGACANGLVEKIINLKVCLEAERILRECYSEYFLVKQCRTADNYVSLSAGCKMANKWGADLFVSVHHNGGGGDGCEVFHSLNTKIGDDFARLLAAEFIALGQNTHGRAVKSRESVKRPGHDYYTELAKTSMPAVISEFAYLDSKDCEIIDSEEEINNEAAAIVKAVCNFFDVKPIEKDGWQVFNNQWHYIENNTQVKLKWIKTNNKWYWLKEDCTMAKDEWLKLSDGKWYCFDKTGAMYSNSVVDIGENGALNRIERK